MAEISTDKDFSLVAMPKIITTRMRPKWSNNIVLFNKPSRLFSLNHKSNNIVFSKFLATQKSLATFPFYNHNASIMPINSGSSQKS